MNAASRRALASILFALPLSACDKTHEPHPTERREAQVAASVTASAIASAPPPSGDARRFLADMNAFCIATQEVKGNAAIARKDKPQAIVRKLVEQKPSPDFLVFLQSLSDKPGGERYPAMKQAAIDRGAANWSCPALATDD